jgi:hypothetical protein
MAGYRVDRWGGEWMDGRGGRVSFSAFWFENVDGNFGLIAGFLVPLLRNGSRASTVPGLDPAKSDDEAFISVSSLFLDRTNYGYLKTETRAHRKSTKSLVIYSNNI